MLTSEQFERLKLLQDRYVKLVFADGRFAICKLFSATTDIDGSQHVVYEDVDGTSSAVHTIPGGSFYVSGEEIVSFESADAR